MIGPPVNYDMLWQIVLENAEHIKVINHELGMLEGMMKVVLGLITANVGFTGIAIWQNRRNGKKKG